MERRRVHVRHSLVAILGLVLLLLAPTLDSIAQTRQLPPSGDDDPPAIATFPPQVQPRPTPTPTLPPRPTPVPTQEPRPTAEPTAVPPTAIQPNPQPAPPDIPDSIPVTIPPLTDAPFLPGTNNRFEITLYTCPTGTDVALDEASMLAACPQLTETGIQFQMRDGDQTHLRQDTAGVYVFDNVTVTPGPRFFILEEFTPGHTDPVVFCGEGDAARARVPAPYRVIRPQLSTFSDADYRCSWFKIPLQGNTVRVHGYYCTAHPTANATFDWFWANCRSQSVHLGTSFVLEDLNGARTTPATGGAVTWTNVDFDANGTIRITRQSSPYDVSPYRVFCGTFNNGAPMLVTNHQVTVPQSADAVPVEYVCRWYRYTHEADFNDSLQIPATLTLVVWMCPAGTDPNTSRPVLLATCVEATPGVNIWITYPDGALLAIPVTGSAPATAWVGLVPQGHLTMTEEVPPGYDARVIDCKPDEVKGWSNGANGANGVNGSVTRYFTWEDHVTCSWFNFAETG